MTSDALHHELPYKLSATVEFVKASKAKTTRVKINNSIRALKNVFGAHVGTYKLCVWSDAGGRWQRSTLANRSLLDVSC